MRRKLGIGILAAMSALALGSVSSASAGVISRAVDDTKLVTLHNETRPEATSLNDRGRLADTTRFGGLELVLKRSPEQEAALERTINDLHNPSSPNFHHWMRAAEVGQRFGLGDDDISKITAWLSSNGLKVRQVSSDRSFISFSGNAGSVSKAFHTEIHSLVVNGQPHYANMSDPRIPSALKNAVVGVMQLHDFYPHPMFVKKKKLHSNGAYAAGCFPVQPNQTLTSYTGRCFTVTPGDLAAIYNFKPTLASGITGLGQTVVVVEDTNVYKAADYNIFKAAMGLGAYTHGTFTQVHPTGAAACTNPGVVSGDDGEAILDVEYAAASAPDAAIVLASCTNTGSNNSGFGGLKAIQNMIAAPNPPKIFSMSYGECEVLNGAAANAAYNTTYQTAAAGGISIYVSSGDESATSCDANAARATHGVGVSGFQSSQYNISVGGTDYTDTTDRTNSTLWATYWNAGALKSNGYASAKGYVPEMPWNNSCASEIMAKFYTNSTLTYGTTGFCNSTFATNEAFNGDIGSGSGGPSGCATGAATTASVVSGTCAGWAKPAYQAGFQGIVADGKRDTPDVALFAANGVWGHFFPFCDSDPADAPGTPYTLSGCQTGDPFNWAGAGGTSFSSPIWAGIQALINQKTGQSWGNTNVQFYALAAAEYGVGGNPSCDSSLGNAASSSCVFHDVTAGDYNVHCRKASGSGGALHNCYLPSGTNGVGTTDLSNASYQPMYRAGSGWDFTTGVGTPNVDNLVNAMNALVVH
jgi:subtilase family serine protease